MCRQIFSAKITAMSKKRLKNAEIEVQKDKRKEIQRNNLSRLSKISFSAFRPQHQTINETIQ